jgi:hypothetical protein
MNGRGYGCGPTARRRPLSRQLRMSFSSTRASIPFCWSVRAARALELALGQPQ